MDESVGVLVVGGGVAAASLIAQLRSDGYDDKIVVVDHDPDTPYDRPPLSKEFLGGEAAAPEAPWWADECELVSGSVVGVNVAKSSVTVHQNDGRILRITGRDIVVATGASPVRIPGIHPDVLHFRTAEDARALRSQLRDEARLVILGAGTIGTELASSAVDRGARVTLVDIASRPLERFLGGYLGPEAETWIREAGVNLMLETVVETVQAANSGLTVETTRGPVQADVVVSAVGTRPCVSWLNGSGLDLRDGIRCDPDGTAVDLLGRPMPHIHAIGDVAAWSDQYGVVSRREDWTSAQRQGRHVARTIMGLSLFRPSCPTSGRISSAAAFRSLAPQRPTASSSPRCRIQSVSRRSTPWNEMRARSHGSQSMPPESSRSPCATRCP